MSRLDDLGQQVGSDKSSHGSEPWMWSMGYLDTYDELFAPLRYKKSLTLLELGWGEYDPERGDHSNPQVGGRSAKMWRRYFPKADIHIIDIERKNNTVPGVHLHQGSQDDADFLTHVHNQSGDFDIIIDDASHVSRLTIASFRLLWPYLRPGGFYCVEDLHTSYHSWYEPFSQDANPNPDLPRPDGGPTAMQFLKRLADDANYRGTRAHGPENDYEWDCYPRRFWRGYSIEWIRFSYQLCIIKKGQL